MKMGPLSVTIRSAGDADALPIRALEEACFTSDRLSLRSIRRLIRSVSARVVVAEAGGGLAGSAVLLTRRGGSSARLYSLAVAPERRKQGIASTILRSVQGAASSCGATSLRLEVREDNRSAERLYLRHGFRLAGTMPGYYSDGAAALRLVKPLTGAEP